MESGRNSLPQGRAPQIDYPILTDQSWSHIHTNNIGCDGYIYNLVGTIKKKRSWIWGEGYMEGSWRGEIILFQNIKHDFKKTIFYNVYQNQIICDVFLRETCKYMVIKLCIAVLSPNQNN